MRVPKSSNPRIQKYISLKQFGVYQKVIPMQTTPVRTVPQNIERPNYAMGRPLIAPDLPEIKDVNQLRGMKRSCKLASSILQEIEKFVQPGVTTDKIDELAHNLVIEAGAYPSPLLYNRFPKSVCTSVNNVAVHGIPDLRQLADGDIINVDVTVYYKGFHGDCSKTFLVGNVDDRGQQLVRVTEECLDVAIKCCGPNVPFSEIGLVIQNHAKKNGLRVIPSILGHGIGEYFHGPPEIYHAKNDYPGEMKPGMTFTIEPAVTHGSAHTVLLDDGWTLITDDGSRASQIEHTILITENGADVLTK